MKILRMIGAAIMGAVTMYFLDPIMGGRRRALMRDQAVHLANEADEAASRVQTEIENRAQGAYHEARKRMTETQVDDRTLEERVRSDAGHAMTNGGAIKVTANNGVVTLRGPVEADQVDNLINRIETVVGVRSVVNQLDIHENLPNA